MFGSRLSGALLRYRSLAVCRHCGAIGVLHRIPPYTAKHGNRGRAGYSYADLSDARTLWEGASAHIVIHIFDLMLGVSLLLMNHAIVGCAVRTHQPSRVRTAHPTPVGAGHARDLVPWTHRSRAWPAPTGERQMCITIWAKAPSHSHESRCVHTVAR